MYKFDYTDFFLKLYTHIHVWYVILYRRTVQESRDELRSSKSQSGVIKSLLQQKSRGRIPGLHGTLGELGAIDAKYDVATSTACPGLRQVVVGKFIHTLMLIINLHNVRPIINDDDDSVHFEFGCLFHTQNISYIITL